MFVRILFATIFVSVLTNAIPTQAEEFTLPTTRSEAMTFYTPVSIGGVEVDAFLIDTGASYPVINQDILERLKADGSAIYVKSLIGTLATKDEIFVKVYRIESMVVGGCFLRDVDVVVFDKLNRLIIGWSVLQRLGKFSFDTRNGRAVFTVTNCNQKVLDENKGLAQGG